MRTTLKISLLAVIALAITACAPPATTNTNTNANANTAPKTTAPTAESLMALDKPAWDAYKNKDGKFFETFLADNFVGFGDDGKRSTKADAVKMISEHKCEVKSHSLSEPHMTPAGADVAVLTYKATIDGTCDGQKIPSPLTVASVFARRRKQHPPPKVKRTPPPPRLLRRKKPQPQNRRPTQQQTRPPLGQHPMR